jgi:hypothetical protein
VIATRRRFACELQRKIDLGVEQERSGKHRAQREVIAEKRRRIGHAQLRPQSLTRHSVDRLDLARSDALEATRRRACPAERLEVRTHRFRRVELLHREHRSDAILELQDPGTRDARGAAIGHCLLVAALDAHLEIEGLPGRDVREEQRFARQPGDRAAPELQLRHRGPRCELTHGFGHERRRKMRDGGRNRVAAGPPDARLELGDPVDE